MKNSHKVSVILPAINETDLLKKTVEIIEEDCHDDVLEYILIVCENTTQDCLHVCEKFVKSDQRRFILHNQHLPFLGGAVREGFKIAKGNYVLMMASDMETDPITVRSLIRESKKNPKAIITASRWIKGGGFKGYNQIKLVLNYIFQKTFSLLYRTNLSDMTFGYRIFPSDVVRSISWEELRHTFLFETLIKPLKLGTDVIEVPSGWKVRSEGGSQNTFMRNFAYFNIGIRVLFYSVERILK